MEQTQKNIRRLIEIRDKAVESRNNDVSEDELIVLGREAVQLAENSDILDTTKFDVLKQLLNHEIRSFKTLLNSDMSLEARAENLILFCVSVVTIIHGKLDI